MDNHLLEILVYPLYKDTLQYDRVNNELICHVDKLAYPIRDGILTMLVGEVRRTVEGTPADPT